MFCFFRRDSSFQAFGRECLFRDSLAENFVTYFLAVISLQKLPILFWHFFYSNTFLAEVSVEICLVYISPQRVLGREIVKKILAKMFCFFW